MTDTDMLYVASLQKRNEELEARVAELEAKHHNECAQIAHYSDELRRAKELLEAAVEGFEYIKPYTSHCDGHCNNCPFENEGWCRIDWRYTDEALELIGEDINVPAGEDGEQND
jgi:hypothetical protein